MNIFLCNFTLPFHSAHYLIKEIRIVITHSCHNLAFSTKPRVWVKYWGLNLSIGFKFYIFLILHFSITWTFVSSDLDGFLPSSMSPLMTHRWNHLTKPKILKQIDSDCDGPTDRTTTVRRQKHNGSCSRSISEGVEKKQQNSTKHSRDCYSSIKLIFF